jgi:hypothetical protein
MAYLDKWEEELNDFVKKHYQSFFIKNQFVFLKKESGQGGMGVMIFSDSRIQIRVVNKNGRFSIELGKGDTGLFWSLDLIKAHFKISDYKIDEDDLANRKKALLDTFNLEDYSGYVSYLNTNFNKIKNLLSSAKYIETKVQLEKLSLEKLKYG